MAYEDIQREEIFSKGFIRLERMKKSYYYEPEDAADLGWTPSLEPSVRESLRIVISNPDESPIKEVVISHEIDKGNEGYRDDWKEGAFEIHLEPHRKLDLRHIFDAVKQNGGTFGADVGGCYPLESEKHLDESLSLDGHVTLHSTYFSDSDPLAWRNDSIWEENLAALYRSRLLGREKVNDAMQEAIEQAMQAVENGFFEKDPDVQRRMLNNIGGKLDRIYQKTYPHDLGRG